MSEQRNASDSLDQDRAAIAPPEFREAARSVGVSSVEAVERVRAGLQAFEASPVAPWKPWQPFPTVPVCMHAPPWRLSDFVSLPSGVTGVLRRFAGRAW